MAKLPPIDVAAHWIKHELHMGNRERALKMIEERLASGKAGAETRALADYLAKAGKGRQPFGRKYLWFEIGSDNDIMRDEGKTHAKRMEELSKKYKIYDESKLKMLISKYEKAMDHIRSIDE